MSAAPRRLTELDRGQALRLLGSVTLGRIVFTRHALPAVGLASHVLDGGHIIAGSRPGAAVVPAAGAAGGVVVAYQADDIDPVSHLGWSVAVTGTARLVAGPGEAARCRQLLTPWPAGETGQVIRIRPVIITGFRLSSRAGSGTPPAP